MDFNSDFFQDATPKASSSVDNTPLESVHSADSLNLDMLSKTNSVDSTKEEAVVVELSPAKTVTNSSKNPYDEWQKSFNERIERLKAKEVEDIEKRTKFAAAELEQWHRDRKKQIEDKLTKLMAEEPLLKKSEPKDFDWLTAAKYLESSEFFVKDQSGGVNQKLIDLVVKKKQLLEKAREVKVQPK